MRALRCAAAAAVALTLILPASVAHAQVPPRTTVVVTPGNMQAQGWAIDQSAPDYSFTTARRSIGTGSLQFEAIPSGLEGPGNPKMFIGRVLATPLALLGVSFDYYIDQPATNGSSGHFYLNVYVDKPGGRPDADCRFDYVPTAEKPGWNTLAMTSTATPTRVVLLPPGSASVPPVTCEEATISALSAGGEVVGIALNAGQSNNTDVGLKGGFDNVVITTASAETVYDFEPAPACETAPNAGPAGTARSDVRRGTPGSDRLDLLGGADVADGLAGDDCLQGGPGTDTLRGGDGADEIRGDADADAIDGGAGADVVTGGGGRDVVNTGAGVDRLFLNDGEVDIADCGAGADIVTADARDLLRNCEQITRV